MLLFLVASYPAAVDFGPIDVHAPAVVRSVTLTNTSDSGLDLDIATHTGSPAFTFSPLPATHLPAGESVTVTVAYDPVAEETDTASLVIPILGETSATIAISGRGIDRHITVAEPVFPPAYRNPGDLAPTVPVTITNTGEASLAVTSLEIAGTPIWQLVAGDPVDIPGGSSYDVLVRFSPTAVGPAPDGALTIHDDDAAQPELTVPLHGSGMLRAVTFGPGVFDLGYTGVGEPLAMSGALAIANVDVVPFQIQRITVDDPRFVVTSGAPIALPPGVMQPVDVTFTGDEPGDYHTTATLFLDEDPNAQATVVLQAHAVFIDAQGGGGCSAGGDAGGGMLLVVALLLLRRKRVLALLLVPAVAQADDRNLDLSLFDPTPATVHEGFQIAAPAVGEQGELVASALLGYASHPLVLASARNEDIAIANRMTLVLGGAYAVTGHLELGAHIPLYIQNGEAIDPKSEAGTPAVGGDARGTLALHAKAELVPGLGALAVLELPTASEDRFAGTQHPAARLLALSTFEVAPRVSLTFDFGAVLRSETRFANITERSGLSWGAGAVYRPRDKLSVTAELYGELVPGGRRDAMGEAGVLATTELLAGAHYQLDPLLSVGVAVGRGVIGGPGAPAFRGLVTFAYAARLGQPRIVHVVPPPIVVTDTHPTAPDASEPSPRAADTDHDGIPDVRDACPAQPERINGVDDDDGCPDAGDGAVVITPDRLELLEPLDNSVLGQIGATLRAHPDIAHLTIVVHASTGDDAAAQKRADAIRDWLIQWGIAANRLEAHGTKRDVDSIELIR
jgi:hypothetical protein